MGSDKRRAQGKEKIQEGGEHGRDRDAGRGRREGIKGRKVREGREEEKGK